MGGRHIRGTARESFDALVRRLSPLSKLIVLGLVGIAVFLFRQWQVAVALTVLPILFYWPGPLGVRRLVPVMKPLPFFIVLIVFAQMFLAGRAEPLERRAIAGLLQGLRVSGLVIVVHLFLSLTDPVSLSDAVMRALQPLRRFGVRVGELSLMTMIVMSFVPLMGVEVKRLHVAQAVRCGFPKRGHGAIRAAVPLIVPLVIGVLRRADELELALRARCYSLDAPRSSARDIGMGRLDYGICAVSIFLFLIGLYAQL